jgi:adenine-specific DNA-methyltransferase
MNFVPMPETRRSIRYTGAVYTPEPVARAISELVAAHADGIDGRVLEPSVGDGAFLYALARTLPEHAFTAVDIDSVGIERLRARKADVSPRSEFHVGDFVSFACDHLETGEPSFSMIVGNPPFIRKHNFSEEFGDVLERLGALTDYPAKSLKNSWAAFLVASAHLIGARGLVAFILPYELMTVSYGQTALLYLLKVFDRIDLYVPNERAFPEIDQDAIIFFARKGLDNERGLRLQHVPSLSDLSTATEHRVPVDIPANLSLELNGFLIERGTIDRIRRIRSGISRISDFCLNAPGVVTAANDFFIQTADRVRELGLDDFALPILKRGSLLKTSPIFTSDDFEELAERQRSRLLKITAPKECLTDAALAYVVTGELQKLDERYKCRNRKPWYNVPLVTPAAGFVFRRSHEFPRLVINEASVYVTDNVYGITPKLGFTIRGICYSFYNSLTFLFAEMDGRFYGGGVLELSPVEFRNLPLAYHEPSEEEFAAFLEVHQSGDVDAILDFGDEWMARKLRMSPSDLDEIRLAWSSVRSHRLRHGRPGTASTVA